MKVKCYFNQDEEDERVEIYAQDDTQKIKEIIACAKQDETLTTLTGKNQYQRVFQVPIEEVLQIKAENKKVYAWTYTQCLIISNPLYELEEILPHYFIRISKSEILNIRNIKYLSVGANGMIHITLKHGEATYSSRRYLKKLKARLKL